MPRWRHHWTCPLCGRENRWSWPAEDHNDVGEETWLQCENCQGDSFFVWQGPGRGWQQGVVRADSPHSSFRD